MSYTKGLFRLLLATLSGSREKSIEMQQYFPFLSKSF